MAQRNASSAHLDARGGEVRVNDDAASSRWPALDAGDAEASGLAETISVLVEGRLLLAVAVAVGVGLGALYAFAAAPVFRADAAVQVEDRSRSIAGLEELSSVFSASTPAETEIEILRSRAVLEGVVDEVGLDVFATPRRFPVFGDAIARLHTGPALAAAPPGLDRFAWGGERIALDRLDVPPRLLGEELRLTALGGDRYRVATERGEPLVEGQVGVAASASGSAEDAGAPRVTVFVSELRARPGTEFTVRRVARDVAVDALQRDVAIAERGRKTGVIELALEGRDPDLLVRVLDAMTRSYVRQNVERKSAEAEKTLEFLKGQLPVLRANAEAAESALQGYRARKGHVDLSLEAKSALETAVDAERRISELELQRADLRRRFTDDHPTLRAIADKLGRLAGERDAIQGRMKRLPDAELQSARLTRDVKVANELYVLVLNKVQELNVVKSGTIGNVRVLDRPRRAPAPVKPNRPAIAVLGALAGVVAGVALAFARASLSRGVDDPAEVERAVNLVVYATVPHSPKQARLERALARAGQRKAHPLLAASDPGELAVEAVRSLRTSVQFAMREAGTNVVAIGGPSPSVGKSFLCANLAHVFAEAGRRVLLVDADLRKGRLHEYLGGARAPGVSEAVTEARPIEELTRATDHPNLHFVAQGAVPPNPSEILASERFTTLVAWASRSYDVVIVDTPPILAVTDAAIVGRITSVTLLVLRAGRHTAREIALSARRYAQNGVRVHAAVMNDVRTRRGLPEYAYHYEYR